jgi:hypothetical protein
MLDKFQIIWSSYKKKIIIFVKFWCHKFSSKTYNNNNQGKERGFVFSGHGLREPYLKQPWLKCFNDTFIEI